MSELTNLKAMVGATTSTTVSATYWLPSVLACNTLLLWTLDRYDAIPGWLKLAATMFLRF